MIRSEDVRKIELCAGYRPRKLGKDWIRHDLRKHEHIDLRCDVWEVPSYVGTVEEIYTKNFLEHLSMIEGKFFIRMCWNMLEDGGKLTIEIPNMDWIIERYVSGYYESPEYFLEWFFGGTGDEWWNMHKTMYNETLLEQRMREGGFTDVKVWNDGYPLFGVGIKRIRR